MMAAASRVGDTLRVGPRWGLLVTLSGLAGLIALTVLVARLDMLPIAVGLAFMAVATLVSFRWPLVALVAFAALIPIERGRRPRRCRDAQPVGRRPVRRDLWSASAPAA